MKKKSLFGKIKSFVLEPGTRFSYLTELGLTKWMSDEAFIKKQFRLSMGYNLDLKNPRTYNEKLQWLKLYNRNPLYTSMVDKYSVKEYVASIIGNQYVIPTIGVWERPEEIDFASLPEQFVLKCTHDSGGIVVCKNKKDLNTHDAIKKLKRCLKRDYYSIHREWPYKDVPRRIIAEKYMEDYETGDLRDYKIFTFNGEAKLLYVASDRQNPNEETKFDFFDLEFNHLPIVNGHPNSSTIPEKPSRLNEMIICAEKISKNIPHLRVDFYEINGRVYFGEATFFHMSGFAPFYPAKWDELFGSWIKLPEYAGGQIVE